MGDLSSVLLLKRIVVVAQLPILLIALLVLSAIAGRADSITIEETVIDDDPATLHIGTGAGTACAFGCGQHPNIWKSNTISIFQNQGGVAGLTDPILLILGVPNPVGVAALGSGLFSSDPILALTSYNPYPGSYPGSGVVGTAVASPGRYGMAALPPGSNGFVGAMGPGQEVYSFLHTWGTMDHSNSFTNWHDTDLADASIHAASFSIYVFDLQGIALSAKGLVDVQFAGSIPVGTYAVAYGTTSSKSSSTSTSGSGTITKITTKVTPFGTPFTEAGMNLSPSVPEPVPEPASLVLLGSGILGLAGWLRRRRA